MAAPTHFAPHANIAKSAGSSASALHLSVDALSVSFAGRRVLTDITFTVAAGECVGLLGENGSGKLTLLRAAAGLLDPDRGYAGPAGVAVAEAAHPAVGLLHQEPPFDRDATVRDAIETAVAPARHAITEVDRAASALAEATDSSAAADYARALDEVERLDAWSIDARVSRMLAGLGLASVDRSRRADTLSGGQLARLSLAWLLLRAPDVLLLDEPTNHLDDDAAEFLRRVLVSWRGPVLFASHDRVFLDEAATSLIDLDPAPLARELAEATAAPGAGSGAGVTRFTGGYSAYLAARTDTRARWERQYRDEQLTLKRLRAGVNDGQQVGHENWTPRTETRAAQKFYADRNARVVARRVNDVRARLGELEARQVRPPVAELRFAALAGTEGPEPSPDAPHAANASAAAALVVDASQVEFTGRLLPVALTLRAGERLLVTGANGAGKSTLLALLAGTLEPTSGTVTLASGLRVGALTQQVHIPDPDRTGPGRTAAEAYAGAVGHALAEDMPLGAFGLLRPEDESQPVGALSLGQQRRLALAILLATPPDLLLLDEPTNHLSLTLATNLEWAIAIYPGTVVVASHDRWLRERWTGSRLALTETGSGSR